MTISVQVEQLFFVCRDGETDRQQEVHQSFTDNHFYIISKSRQIEKTTSQILITTDSTYILHWSKYYYSFYYTNYTIAFVDMSFFPSFLVSIFEIFLLFKLVFILSLMKSVN